MDNNFKYTCLFGGGAIRGVSYIGAVKALEELGIIPDRLAGYSVGSIFAALLAVGLGPLFAISKGEVFLEWVRELIEKKYYGENYKKGVNPAVTFKDIKKNLVVITTNLSNFECKEFSKFDTPDYEIASAVRISCCMPGLMKPIEYNKTLLVDGDLQKSWPMWKLSKHLLNDDERILEFRLEGNYESNDISGINYANAVYSCMTAISTSFITNIYGNKDKFDYIVLNTGDIVVVDFNINEAKRNDLINSGYNQTISYFKDFLIEKKSKIRHNYSIILTHITKIQKYIKSNNIQKAKNQMGELFMDLPELSEIIDLTDYNEIKKFRDIFLKNLKYPALFGKVTLSNFKLIDTELNKINNKISKKLEEFDSYLKTYQKK